MVQVELCTQLTMLDKSAIFIVIPKDKADVLDQTFMLILKNLYFVSCIIRPLNQVFLDGAP